jgi:hypothetical protein
MPVKESTSKRTTSAHDHFRQLSYENVLRYISNGGEIPSNIEVDRELQLGTYDQLTPVKGWVGIWTGTVLVCEAPGKEFGKTVEYQGIVFEVPEKYQGKKDVALVLDNSTLKIEARNGKLWLTAEVGKCHTLPAENGWGIPDTDTGIPTEVTDGHPDPKDCYRCLLRSRIPYIGFIARGLGNGDARKTVYIEFGPGDHLWVKEVPKQPQGRPNVVVHLDNVHVAKVVININDGKNGLNELLREDAA